jgi:ATP-dependent Clp protease ATP-binding subunit ClpC
MPITPRCQRAIDTAEDAARRFGAVRSSSPHLVLGLLSLKDGVAVRVLVNGGVTEEEVEDYLAKVQPPENPALRDSVAAAVVRAVTEAQKASHTYVGTEHLLLALLADEDKQAAALFSTLAFDRVSARELLIHSLV